jgi:hypothetical protein
MGSSLPNQEYERWLVLLKLHRHDPNAVLAVFVMILICLTRKKIIEIGKKWFNDPGTGDGCTVPV